MVDIKNIIINDRVINLDELAHVTPPIPKLNPEWGESKPSIGLIYLSNPGNFECFSFNCQEIADKTYSELMVKWDQEK